MKILFKFIEIILFTVNKIKGDKLEHFFLASMLGYLFIVVPGVFWGLKIKIIGFILCLLIFIYKEIVRDKAQKLGTFDIKDILWGLFATILILFNSIL